VCIVHQQRALVFLAGVAVVVVDVVVVVASSWVFRLWEQNQIKHDPLLRVAFHWFRIGVAVRVV
jgi:hypothetical protein